MHAPKSPDPGPIIPPDVLLLAYRSGVFPMADSREEDEVFWVEPRRRAILPLDGFHCSRSLAKVLRAGRYRVTVDAAFTAVIDECAEPRRDHPDTWISGRIAASYRRLHELGHAHSVECWDGEELVGGLYGVAVRRAFCGESMFSRRANASKVALAWLVVLLRRAGFQLLDCQFMTEHLASLGAVEITRDHYLALLARACDASPAATLGEAYVSVLGEASGVGVGEGAGAGAAAGAAGAAVAEAGSSPGKVIAQSLTQTS